MVNSKNVLFKVNKQTPISGPTPQAYGTVINCRKPGGRRALKAQKEVISRRVRLAKISGAEEPDPLDKKRKRDVDEPEGETFENCHPRKLSEPKTDASNATSRSPTTPANALQKSRLTRPTRLRRGKRSTKGVDIDCWFIILSYSNPAQLLEMRSSITSCYRYLRDNPKLWEYSRIHAYGHSLPGPPSELTEFQYAQLRHGHGCMSCGAPSTRKTYWAFLRRWCKTCLQSKTIKEHDARALFKDSNGDDISFISKCLPSGIFDSWGNFVGAGPATNHSMKTVYLLSDVQKLVAEFIKEGRDNYVSWHAEMRTWIANKAKVVDERRDFARTMEHWEDATRTTKTVDYNEKKYARKMYFTDKASQLSPPIDPDTMECCPSYRRAIAIPKEPNMTSWLQLKPKLEKEAAALKTRPTDPLFFSTSGSSTPNTKSF